MHTKKWTTEDNLWSTEIVTVDNTKKINTTGAYHNHDIPGTLDWFTDWRVIMSFSAGFVILFICCCLLTRRMLRSRQSTVQSKQPLDLWHTKIFRTTSATGTLTRSFVQPSEANTSVLESLSVNDHLKEETRKILIDIDRLRLGDLIGKGEFGYVKKAYLSSTNGGGTKLVAVKTIRDKYRICELEEFLREGAMSSTLEHDNILQVIGIAIKSSPDSEYVMPLVVMPFMKHGDLRSHLLKMRKYGKRNYSEHQLTGFALQISRGMSYLSQKNYIHRDLAARNCMLDGGRDNYTVKIADFGLARKVYSANYQMKKLTKLPFRWLAPEALGQFTFTTKTDVWAFGVTMWEIFTFGDTPYPGVDNSELLRYITNGGRLNKPRDCTDKIWKVMSDCWSKSASGRPTFQMLENRLKEIRDDRFCTGYFPVRSSYINVGCHGSSDA